MNKIKFGVVGYGSIAQKHVKLVKRKYSNSDIKILVHKKKKIKIKIQLFL